MTSNQDLPPEAREMLIVAVFWDWRLRSLNISMEEWLHFRRWHAVEAHRVILERVRAAREQQASGRLLRSLATASSRSRLARWSRIAAALLALALAQFGPAGTLPSYQILETTSAASARALKDGSIVRAAANTRIQIELSHSRRMLSIFRGEAFFDVAHEPDRPFLVRTPDALIEATGTRFGVSVVGAVTVVTVTEGTVAVSQSSSYMELHTGQQAEISQLQTPVVSDVKAEEALAWATTIAFDEVAASEALQQFSARNGLRMHLKAPGSARAVTISGTFQLDNPKAFAAYVANRTSAIVSVGGPGLDTTDVAPRPAVQTR